VQERPEFFPAAASAPLPLPPAMALDQNNKDDLLIWHPPASIPLNELPGG